jgi:hypothetical protein
VKLFAVQQRGDKTSSGAARIPAHKFRRARTR